MMNQENCNRNGQDVAERQHHADVKNREYYEPQCVRIVNSLLNAGINLFCIDFDDTLVNINTYHLYKSRKDQAFNPDFVLTRVRPLFSYLIPMCMENNINIAIVTFNPDVESINLLLGRLYPGISNRIVVVGNDRRWEYVGRGCAEAKQGHMAVAAETFFTRGCIPGPTRMTTLLLDDDAGNVEAAVINGVRAIVFQTKNESETINDLIAMEGVVLM